MMFLPAFPCELSNPRPRCRTARGDPRPSDGVGGNRSWCLLGRCPPIAGSKGGSRAGSGRHPWPCRYCCRQLLAAEGWCRRIGGRRHSAAGCRWWSWHWDSWASPPWLHPTLLSTQIKQREDTQEDAKSLVTPALTKDYTGKIPPAKPLIFRRLPLPCPNIQRCPKSKNPATSAHKSLQNPSMLLRALRLNSVPETKRERKSQEETKKEAQHHLLWNGCVRRERHTERV